LLLLLRGERPNQSYPCYEKGIGLFSATEERPIPLTDLAAIQDMINEINPSSAPATWPSFPREKEGTNKILRDRPKEMNMATQG
jgi:hypothetical protein